MMLLYLTVPPYFVTRPENTYGRVMEDIELQCNVKGTPTPSVQWLKVCVVCNLLCSRLELTDSKEMN